MARHRPGESMVQRFQAQRRTVSVLPKMWQSWHRHVAKSVLSSWAAKMAFAIGIFILVVAGTTIIGAMVLSLMAPGDRHGAKLGVDHRLDEGSWGGLFLLILAANTLIATLAWKLAGLLLK
jgi:hypothetical protein